MLYHPIYMRVYLTAVLIIVAFTLVTDIAFWQIAKSFLKKKRKISTISKVVYWLTPVFFFLIFGYMSLFVDSDSISEKSYYNFTMLNGAYLLLYLPKFITIVVYSLGYILSKAKELITFRKEQDKRRGKGISRAQFLGRLSLIVGAIPFASIMYNITNGRFKFSVHKTEVPCKKLPKKLDGLRIIQLSDFHLGNFNSHHEILEEVVEQINKLKADLIFITGDLVNNFHAETKGWEDLFLKLNAKHGKYAVLGNHDYGDYSEWKSPKLKQVNFQGIKQAYEDFGFELLLNANKTIEINGEVISLIGVENWGHPPFPRYGDLNMAMNGELSDFKILLSHDPDHWEAEILNETDIDLTLAGHTHGMQVGLKWKTREWSPAKWKYKHWGGLYQEDDQYLYVNRGLGFVGVPLRVGMPPEVTFLKLKTT